MKVCHCKRNAELRLEITMFTDLETQQLEEIYKFSPNFVLRTVFEEEGIKKGDLYIFMIILPACVYVLCACMLMVPKDTRRRCQIP